MRRTLEIIGLFGLCLMLPAILLQPAHGGAIRFRHLFSIYTDSLGTGLKHPQGVACGGDNRLIVADTGNARLVRFTFTDDTATPRTEVFKLSRIQYPQTVRTNSRGDIYVLDGRQRRIVRLQADGQFAGYLEPSLPGAPAMLPRNFDIAPDDTIYILDLATQGVVVTDPVGRYLRSIRYPKTYGFISGVAVDAAGRVLAVDSVRSILYSASAGEAELTPLGGAMKAIMRFPTQLAVDPAGSIFAVDHNGSKVILLSKNGAYLDRLSTMGWKEGLLNHPSQICFNRRNQVIIADTDNHRIQFFEEIE